MPVVEIMINYWLLAIPAVSALAGWIICKIGLRFFIFREWPKKQPQLAAAISRYAAAEFASLNLEKKIGDPSNLKKAQPIVEAHVDNFLRVKLKEEMPMISMFIGDKTIESLKGIFMRELENLFPEVMKNFADNIKNDLDVESIISKKITAISPVQLRTLAKKELRQIELFGAIAGLIIGIIQLLLLTLLPAL